jgi:hypothetical protein
MDEIKCPYCGSKRWRCWDERQLTWWQKDGSMGAIQILGMLACLDCKNSYVDANPSNAELEADGLWVDDDEESSAWR